MVKKLTTSDGSKPELSLAVIEDLKSKGHSQADIARLFGVSRQAITWWKYTYNGALTPREIVLQNFPWTDVSKKHGETSVYRRLRDHGEYMATGGAGMSYEKLQRLRKFYRDLRERDVVIEYDPALPPQPGFAINGGFALRPRRKSDGDLLIRVNKHTTLTEEGQMIWVFPPQEP
jgi:hypothetical protein